MSKKILAKPRGIIIFLFLFSLILIFSLGILFFIKPETRLFLLLFASFVLFGIYYIIKTFTYLKIGRDFIKHGFYSKNKYDKIKKIELYDLKE